MTGADLTRIVAIVPVQWLSGAKSRLGEPLDPEERVDLVMAMLRRTVAASLATPRLHGVTVVSQDPDLLVLARAMGATAVLQKTDGLNEGLSEARDSTGAGVTAVLVLPADLPEISAEAIDRLLEAADEAGSRAPDRPVVALVSDRHGTGTNALLVAPPNAIPFRFGEGSRAAHEAEAAAAGAVYAEVRGPLSFDVDTPEDLLQADSSGFGHEAGR
jgi:2-phospho-L-lactate guanylyltransferase